jgi:hypothetical protein
MDDLSPMSVANVLARQPTRRGEVWFLRSVQLLLSLFPGFRDFRTPVVVGALWCAVFWVLAQWQLAPESEAVSQFVSESDVLRWKDYSLLGLIGVFIAYVVGVAATLDTNRGWTRFLIDALDARRDSAQTYDASSILLLDEARGRIESATRKAEKRSRFDAQADAAKYNDYSTLKARLRVPSAELFLECDKLDAEASLRLSSAFPIGVGSAVAWMWLDEPLFAVGLGVAVVLALRAVNRALEARDAAREAIAAGVVSHPLRDLIASFDFSDPVPPSDKGDKEAGVS